MKRKKETYTSQVFIIYFSGPLLSTSPASTHGLPPPSPPSAALPPRCSISPLAGAFLLATSWPSAFPPLPHHSVVPFTHRLSPLSVPFFQQPSLPSLPHRSFLSVLLPPPTLSSFLSPRDLPTLPLPLHAPYSCPLVPCPHSPTPSSSPHLPGTPFLPGRSRPGRVQSPSQELIREAAWITEGIRPLLLRGSS